ncbi:MAG: flagellar export chaperone FliS [Acidobacteria bacterium]|nr:flagellar export chaperone FliS [Acidobacteriota bacterium]MBI3662978.1 flagellar export chaperone FliS [Acidobacteriota bacterium]
MNADPARSYKQFAAGSASPVGLVVMLYDAAMSSLERATQAVDAGDTEKRSAALNHVLAVIGELQGCLNFERGGEVAQRLERFYSVARGKVLEAHIKVSRKMLEELSGQFASLREAWQEVERAESGNTVKMQPSPSVVPPRAASVTPLPAAVHAGEPERVAGRWSA